MTYREAAKHSLSQLREMRAAAGRIQARRLLLLMPTVFAGVAAAMHKENSAIYKDHEKTLRRLGEL